MTTKNTQSYIDMDTSYGAVTHAPLPVVLERGEGSWVWDVDGKKYLDMMAAYSTISFGHCHPELAAVATAQISKLCLVSRAFYSRSLGPFLKKLCEVSGLDKALPMNTGAEAVETAIKAARRWGEDVKGIPKDKCRIIVNECIFRG